MWNETPLPALAVLQLLSLLQLLPCPSAGKPPCPAQLPCQCTDLRIKCVQLDRLQLHYLSRVPYFVPSNYETRWSYSFHEMRVRDQALTNLTLQFPWGILSVKKVEVTNSLVRRILPDAFKGLMGIESLNLSHNLLGSLSQLDLADLPSLRELVLHNNQIRTVHPGVFYHTAFIAKLYLSHNMLQDVPPDVRQLTSLTHLYFQYNNISIIRNYAFDGLRKLIILDLGALRTYLRIQDHAFCGLSAAPDAGQSGEGEEGGASALLLRDRGLVALYLRENVLSDLNLCALGRLHGLRGLNLSGTFFPCTCRAASLANRTAWPTTFGFSPRYVMYESWQLANCHPQQCPGPSGPCSAPCVPQSAFQSPRQLRADVGDWQFGARLSVRDDGFNRGDGGRGLSPSLLMPTLLLAWLSAS